MEVNKLQFACLLVATFCCQFVNLENSPGSKSFQFNWALGQHRNSLIVNPLLSKSKKRNPSQIELYDERTNKFWKTSGGELISYRHLKNRRISNLTAPLNFRSLAGERAAILLGSRYFRIVKKRLFETKRTLIMKLEVPFMSVTNYHINKPDWINRKCSKMSVL